jgi:uncharacterized protein YuzE
MRMTYDPGVDALMIKLDSTTRVARMKAISPTTFLEFDAKDRLLGIEILDASALYPDANLRVLESPVEWLTLAEAGREAGLSPETLRKQLQAGRLEGRKRGRDWQVAHNALWNYLEERDARGRPPASARGRRIRAARRRKPVVPRSSTKRG